MVVLKDISFRTHLGNFFIFRSICCDDLQAETTQEDEDLRFGCMWWHEAHAVCMIHRCSSMRGIICRCKLIDITTPAANVWLGDKQQWIWWFCLKWQKCIDHPRGALKTNVCPVSVSNIWWLCWGCQQENFQRMSPRISAKNQHQNQRMVFQDNSCQPRQLLKLEFFFVCRFFRSFQDSQE